MLGTPHISPSDDALHDHKVAEKILEIKRTTPTMSTERVCHTMYMQGFTPIAPPRMRYICKALVVLGALPALGHQQRSMHKLRTVLELNPNQLCFQQKVPYHGTDKLDAHQSSVLNEARTLKSLHVIRPASPKPLNLSLSHDVRAFLCSTPLTEGWSASRIIEHINTHRSEQKWRSTHYTRTHLEYDINHAHCITPGLALHPNTDTLCIMNDSPAATPLNTLNEFISFCIEHHPQSLKEVSQHLHGQSTLAPHDRTLFSIRSALHLLHVCDDTFSDNDSTYTRLKPHWDQVAKALQKYGVAAAKNVLKSVDFSTMGFRTNDATVLQKALLLAQDPRLHALQTHYNYAQWRHKVQSRAPNAIPHPDGPISDRKFPIFLLNEMTHDPSCSFDDAVQRVHTYAGSVPKKLPQIHKVFGLLSVCPTSFPNEQRLHALWLWFLETKTRLQESHARQILDQSDTAPYHLTPSERDTITRAHRLISDPALYALYSARRIPIPPHLNLFAPHQQR